MAVDLPTIPDIAPATNDRGDVLTNQLEMLVSLTAEELEETPIKKMTPSLLWNKLYVKTKIQDQGTGAGPRIAKCLVYKIGGRLADLLEERHPDIFLGSKFINGLREVGRTKYPPYTKQVTTDAQWQDYMDMTEGLYLVRRNPQNEEKAGASSNSGATKFLNGTKLQVKDIFTGELAPVRPAPRVGTGRVGRPPKVREPEAELYGEEEVESAVSSSGFDAEVPLTVEAAWQRVWELGGKLETINSRVVPARIKRSGY